MMSPRVKWLSLSVAASMLLAAISAWLVTDWTLHRHGLSHADHEHLEPDFHAWMHENLDLTPEQHEKLEPVEAEFEQQRQRLRLEIRTAGRELAELIRTSEAEDPRLMAALQKLGRSQSELQKATLNHFFAMKRYLRPAQAAKLLDWTHDSLAREP